MVVLFTDKSISSFTSGVVPPRNVAVTLYTIVSISTSYFMLTHEDDGLTEGFIFGEPKKLYLSFVPENIWKFDVPAVFNEKSPTKYWKNCAEAFAPTSLTSIDIIQRFVPSGAAKLSAPP